ncbi:MAG TPA: 1-deoxy-D-xylulose-5-phosphate reductoisomerase [Candidatus Cloacimonadota bacterium]|nr:1-deoxy-D-xylulose-5-phosphate reductoisomerase [Candidatus Cloacimonadota bacterium]HOQ80021.1 1-deoxy-D-xylulose-5-phosphate reductoisomerase [Candidatus Cloacimonadota bacterium]
MKKIALLGMSGSIGSSTLNIMQNHQKDFSISFASVHNNVESAIKSAVLFNIPIICITGEQAQKVMEADYPEITFYYGQNSLLELLKNEDYDICLNAVTGSAGLPYTIEVLKRGKKLALANKESLVMAGHLVKELLKKSKNKILPVDSEHSAIFQCMKGHNNKEVKQLHITASGGPFRNTPLKDFKNIQLENALKHPTWSMGTKVTIDSATMFNKGLEVIEAHWLFDLPYEQITALIHPQSIIHSMVEFVDGSILAQMSKPSMELPILYALSYPKHIPSQNVETDFFALSELTFQKIEKERYPLFFIALQAGASGGLYPTIMNAANEAALSFFLKKKIHFTQIAELVEKALNHFENKNNPSLEEIFVANKQAYDYIAINQK